MSLSARAAPAEEAGLMMPVSHATQAVLLRAFAIVWWLMVMGWGGDAMKLFVLGEFRDRADAPVFLVFRLLPFVVLTIARRGIAGRWRFGPHW